MERTDSRDAFCHKNEESLRDARALDENVPLSVEETGEELHRRQNRVFSFPRTTADQFTCALNASDPQESLSPERVPDENVRLSVEETGDMYRTSDQLSRPEAVFIDRNMDQIIQRAWSVDPILDRLLCDGVIHQESYDIIRAKSTEQEKMRTLLTGPIRASGDDGKIILYYILMEREPHMMIDLGAMGGNHV